MPDPVSERRLKDASLSRNVALPSGAATANTNSIDLGQATPFPVTESFLVKLTTTTANGANSKNITCKLQDSADNTTFTNIAELGSLVVTDAAGAGYPAGTITASLPTSTRRYVRAQATGEVNGGNAANGTLTVEFLF